MKKLLILLIAVSLLFSFVSCDGNAKSSGSSSTSSGKVKELDDSVYAQLSNEDKSALDEAFKAAPKVVDNRADKSQPRLPADWVKKNPKDEHLTQRQYECNELLHVIYSAQSTICNGQDVYLGDSRVGDVVYGGKIWGYATGGADSEGAIAFLKAHLFYQVNEDLVVELVLNEDVEDLQSPNNIFTINGDSYWYDIITLPSY